MQIVVGLVLAILYITACITAVLVIGVPTALVLGSTAAAVGAVGALGLITVTFVGRADERALPADEGVAAHVLPGRPAPVEPAWQHYLSRQWSMDVHAAYDRVEDVNARMWRKVHDVIGQAAGEFPAVLWPLAWVPYAVAAAATVGAVVGGAVAVVVVGVPATLVGLLRAGWVRVLRRRERSRQRRQGVAAVCTAEGCDDVGDRPVVECRCGRRHHRLQPGRFGAARRRCTCGCLLPTSVTVAARTADRRGLRLRCRRCDRPLAAGTMLDTDVRLAVLGAPCSGRSTVVAAGLDDLRAAVSSRGGRVEELNQPDEPSPVDRTCRSVRVLLHRRCATLHVYDPVGDALDVPGRRRRLHHLRHAHGFLLVVDAAALPRIAGRVPGDGPPVDPEHTYRATVSHLRDDGVDPAGRALAVVLRRLDAVAAAGIAVPADDTSAATSAWLASAGADGLVVAAGRDFGSVRYLASGTQEESEAYVAAAALAWLAGQAGFSVPPHRSRNR